MDGKWASVQQAEVDVSLVKEDYIIDGKIDLVKGVDGTVEIVDFKSERKPDMVKMRERLEHYRRQLQIYAYLIEQRTGQKVSKMHAKALFAKRICGGLASASRVNND